jgi:hypothetical protein
LYQYSIDGGVLHQIKIGAKVTFLNDDSGVKSELTKFQALIDKQSRVTEATTLQHVLANEKNTVEILKSQFLSSEKLKGMETGVNVLVADMNDRKTERITSERVEAIAKKLSMTGESVQEAKVALQTMRESRLEGSAQWLLGHPDYKEWITPDTDSIPLLLLSGDTKTGKSRGDFGNFGDHALFGIDRGFCVDEDDAGSAHNETVIRPHAALHPVNIVLDVSGLQRRSLLLGASGRRERGEQSERSRPENHFSQIIHDYSSQ